MDRKQPQFGAESAFAISPRPRGGLDRRAGTRLGARPGIRPQFGGRPLFGDPSAFRVALIAGLIGGLFLAACARPAGEPSATGAWMRAVPQGGVGAIYLELHNPGGEARRLVEARFEEAAATEMHETVQEGDLLRMVELEAGLLLAAGESAAFEPGGRHIMLLDLHRDMAEGDTATLRLIFEDGAELEVPVEVRDPLDLGG